MPRGMDYQTYQGWRNAIKKLDPNAKFEGNKDIANAFGKGISNAHWDGDSGTISMRVATSSDLSSKVQKAVKKAAHFAEGRSMGSIEIMMDETANGWRIRYGSIGGSLHPLARGLSKFEAERVITELREKVEKPDRISPIRSIVEIPKRSKRGSFPPIRQRTLDRS